MQEFTTRPELCGTVGAVASTHWIASAVGMRMLDAGRNAFDAAASAGFVLQIVEPHLNGPGGDAPILVARAGDPMPTVICGQGPAPAAATIEHFEGLGLDLIPGTGLLAACVPGAFGAWLTMLRDHGTATLREVLEPAIFYARHGQPLLKGTVDTIASVQSLFRDEWDSSADIWLKHGAPPVVGSLFTNPVLADLYERIVLHAEGASMAREAQIDAALAYWYEGPVAEAIGLFCRDFAALDVSGERHQGLLTAGDLAGWRPPIERPLSVEQGEYSVFKCGPWSQGPAVLQALRILHGFDLAALDPEGPEFVHLVTETLKLVMADRDAWYGDEPSIPLDGLLSEDYATGRRDLIGQDASVEFRPGEVGGRPPRLPSFQREKGLAAGIAGGGEPTMADNRLETRPAEGYASATQRGDTCHLDVVDRWGNMVSATPSGGWLQSSPAIPGLGFALGTRMQMFWLTPDLPNSLAPSKRPRTTLTPSMAYRDGRPYLAFGTPGGDQQEQWSLLLWLFHSVYGRPLQRAIETPAFHTDHLIASFWPRETALGTLSLEGRFSQSTIDELERRGHQVSVGGPWSEGRLSACVADWYPDGLILRAGANPRGMQGYAIAR